MDRQLFVINENTVSNDNYTDPPENSPTCNTEKKKSSCDAHKNRIKDMISLI